LIDLYTTLALMQPTWDFVMFYQSDTAEDPFSAHANIRRQKVDIAGDRFNLWQDVRLPFAALTAGAAVLHCPANTAPWRAFTPIVVTIHDIIPLEIDPHGASTTTWAGKVSRAAAIAQRIITPSEYSRRAIVRQLGASEEKITVNAWAPDRRCRRVDSPAALSAVRQKYGVPEHVPYVLVFGAEDPRKNTSGIIAAWSQLDPQIRRTNRLLVVGLQAAALERYRSSVAASPGDDTCLLHGFADEDDIAPLLTGAAALCYPSRSEGFGLPVLDAFACGTPVITSATTSLPEVAGDAAILVDPDQPGAIASALAQVLTSETTRTRLREAGTRRLGLFSWERCARTVAGVLEAASKRS
jgi:glycosyltransferase involved in cell wall biosynthesis